MANWYVQNLTTLEEAKKHAERRKELISRWREIQNILLKTDASQLKWCSNQRYSLPIYSFLDPWWSEQERGDDRDPDFRPPDEEDLTTLTISPPKDTIYDFSALSFASGTSLKIPVLHPTFVPLKLPHPPAPGVHPEPAGNDMPDLLPVPDTTIFDTFNIPDVDLPSVAVITPPASPDLTQAIEMLKKMKARMQAMSVLYKQFQMSFLIPPDDEQREGNVGKIIHVENDLRERIQRGFARWMPLRSLDYRGRTDRVDAMNPEPPCHEDVICLPLLGVSITTSEWQWYVPSFTSTFDDLRDTLRTATLPPSEDESPYAAPTIDVLRRLFPPLSLPIPFTLAPPPSRSR